MKKLTSILAAAVVVCLPLPASAMTVDEVIDKHIAARGGRDNWNAVESMKVTGEYTAFSLVKPFTMHRARDNRYHMDHFLGKKLVVVGYDGKTAWWENHWFGEAPQKIGGVDLAVIARDVDFINPLFDYKAKGYEAKLLGNVDVEGLDTIGIELTRDDDSVEKWYLDPETYLEVARDSPGSDFGRPMEQRTFYDDFRTVEGVVLPFYTETQWYTRDRVMRIEEVALNVAVEDDLFKMPAPPGMGVLQSLPGTWEVKAKQRQQPGAPWQESERKSTIELKMNGGMLHEEFSTADGSSVIRTLSFDQFHKGYRLTVINSQQMQLDVHEGQMGEDGKLVLSNVETGTTWSGFGFTFNGRTSIFDITEDGFVIEQEISTDGGENWFVADQATYTRAAD